MAYKRTHSRETLVGYHTIQIIHICLHIELSDKHNPALNIVKSNCHVPVAFRDVLTESTQYELCFQNFGKTGASPQGAPGRNREAPGKTCSSTEGERRGGEKLQQKRLGSLLCLTTHSLGAAQAITGLSSTLIPHPDQSAILILATFQGCG